MASPDASILSFILDAGPVVKSVMFLLLLASVFSWTFIFQRSWYLKRASQSANAFEDDFWSGTQLSELFQEIERSGARCEGVETIFHAGFKEYLRLSQKGNREPDAILQGVQRAMRVATARAQEELESHLSFLATVGSTSPYVGLFGTVWGIMTSFRALGAVQQATIAMVAPGISEALIATAMGLFAAIPAVIAYNRFADQAERLLNRYDAFSEEFAGILFRQVQVDDE